MNEKEIERKLNDYNKKLIDNLITDTLRAQPMPDNIFKNLYHNSEDEEVYNIENAITEVLSEMDIPKTISERFKRNVMMRVMQKFKGFVNPSKVADSINKRFEKES